MDLILFLVIFLIQNKYVKRLLKRKILCQESEKTAKALGRSNYLTSAFNHLGLTGTPEKLKQSMETSHQNRAHGQINTSFAYDSIGFTDPLTPG